MCVSLGHLGCEDLAGPIVFLASRQAEYTVEFDLGNRRKICRTEYQVGLEFKGGIENGVYEQIEVSNYWNQTHY